VPLSFDQHGRQHYKGLYEVPAFDELESFSEHPANNAHEAHPNQPSAQHHSVPQTHHQVQQQQGAGFQYSQQAPHYLAPLSAPSEQLQQPQALHKVSVDQLGRQHYKGLYDPQGPGMGSSTAVTPATQNTFAAPARTARGHELGAMSVEYQYSTGGAPYSQQPAQSVQQQQHFQQQQQQGMVQPPSHFPPPPPGMYYAPYPPNGGATNAWILQPLPSPHGNSMFIGSSYLDGAAAMPGAYAAPPPQQQQQQQQQQRNGQYAYQPPPQSYHPSLRMDQQYQPYVQQPAPPHMTMSSAANVNASESTSQAPSMAGIDPHASRVVGGRIDKPRTASIKPSKTASSKKTGGATSTRTAPATMQTNGDHSELAANAEETQEVQDMTNLPKIRRYTNTEASKFCHICARSMDTVRAISCFNTLFGVCRKIVCEKCFHQNGWDWEAASKPGARWACIHCKGLCPDRAQCNTYKRTNQRRRMKGMQKRKELEQLLLSSGADSVSGLITPSKTEGDAEQA